MKFDVYFGEIFQIFLVFWNFSRHGCVSHTFMAVLCAMTLYKHFAAVQSFSGLLHELWWLFLKKSCHRNLLPGSNPPSLNTPPTQIFPTFSSAGRNVAIMATKYFFQIFPTFSSAGRNIARMATKYFFQIFSKFSSAGRNIARMATKYFFEFSQNFQALAKMLPEWQQNVFFKIFQNFQALAKMLPEWQQNVFFQIFQNFKR